MPDSDPPCTAVVTPPPRKRAHAKKVRKRKVSRLVLWRRRYLIPFRPDFELATAFWDRYGLLSITVDGESAPGWIRTRMGATPDDPPQVMACGLVAKLALSNLAMCREWRV